jgi:hypothetical protein
VTGSGGYAAVRGFGDSSRFTIRIRVSNRFGEALAGARFYGTILVEEGKKVEAYGSTGREGGGLVTFELPVARYKSLILYRVEWTDGRGVVRAIVGQKMGPSDGLETGGTAPPQGEHGFVITMRACPHQLPLPEIVPTTRQFLLKSRGGRRVHEVYEDARDSLIAGLPAASACMAGKAIEAGIQLRGRSEGWPVESWLRDRHTLGDYLNESVVEGDLSATFTPHFFRTLKGANLTRIEGANDVAESTHVDEAKALLRTVTKLLDGWFSTSP